MAENPRDIWLEAALAWAEGYGEPVFSADALSLADRLWDIRAQAYEPAQRSAEGAHKEAGGS